MIDVELGHAIQLSLTEGAVAVLVASELHIGDEMIIREVGQVNADIARFIQLRGAGFRSGQGCGPFRQHRCAQRQGECSCHSGSADASNELVQFHKTPPLSRKGKAYPHPVIILT